MRVVAFVSFAAILALIINFPAVRGAPDWWWPVGTYLIFPCIAGLAPLVLGLPPAVAKGIAVWIAALLAHWTAALLFLRFDSVAPGVDTGFEQALLIWSAAENLIVSFLILVVVFLVMWYWPRIMHNR